jgi:hypothetical protein
MKNGLIVTSICGPSSSPRPASFAGLPIVNEPPAIGTMSKLTFVSGMVSEYGFRSGMAAAAWCIAARGCAVMVTSTRPRIAAKEVKTRCDDSTGISLL